MKTISRKSPVYITQFEFKVLEVVVNRRVCSSFDVTTALGNDADLLLVMRTLHNLVEKGILERMRINSSGFYKTKPNFKKIRDTLKIDTSL